MGTVDAHWKVSLYRNDRVNPPEMVGVGGRAASAISEVPSRPRRETAAKQLKTRTLTNLYNARPQWFSDAHVSLDVAVAGACAWDLGISEDVALERLLKLNSE